jgi:hypothetical protein
LILRKEVEAWVEEEEDCDDLEFCTFISSDVSFLRNFFLEVEEDILAVVIVDDADEISPFNTSLSIVSFAVSKSLEALEESGFIENDVGVLGLRLEEAKRIGKNRVVNQMQICFILMYRLGGFVGGDIGMVREQRS